MPLNRKGPVSGFYLVPMFPPPPGFVMLDGMRGDPVTLSTKVEAYAERAENAMSAERRVLCQIGDSEGAWAINASTVRLRERGQRGDVNHRGSSGTMHLEHYGQL